ncbi:MAG: hypothetical protein AAFV47_08965 [Pseudomonadota bacterium]
MNNGIETMVSGREIDEELRVVDYVAGRMRAEERQHFEEQMQSSPAMAAAVAHERSLRDALTEGKDAGVPPAAGFERLRDQLAPPMRQRSDFRLAAGIAAVAGLTVSLALLIEPEPPSSYEGLSSELVSPSDHSTDIRLMFSHNADDTIRQEVSDRLGFDIVSGPGPGGSYVVRPRSDEINADPSSWIKDPDVRFAERIVYQP